ncbi:MAG: MFS transporter [bacterium]|nr:MAG: MFS transporter [bacterium]
MVGFFPMFFKGYWSQGADVTHSTFYLGLANSIASILVVILAPILGAIADVGRARKKFLALFAFIGISMTTAMPLVGEGRWVVASVFFVMAVVGFSGGNVFYDSLLMSVTDESRVDFVSALGYSLGYLGGGLLFAVNVWMYMSPASFGLSGPEGAVRISFLSAALWWGVFTVPLLLFVRESGPSPSPGKVSFVSRGFSQLSSNFREVRKLRIVLLFLVGYWLYIDGVHTIIRMAIDYGLSMGLRPESVVIALLITQFVGFPSAIVFGKLGEKLGPKIGIYIGISVYIAMTVKGYFLRTETDFFTIAVVVGMVQGGVQSLSRSFYTRIIPPDRAAEFFGFYNMVGKFAAVLGPFLMGWMALVTGSPRSGILSIVALFVAGGILLFFVDEEKGREMLLESRKQKAETSPEN